MLYIEFERRERGLDLGEQYRGNAKYLNMAKKAIKCNAREAYEDYLL